MFAVDNACNKHTKNITTEPISFKAQVGITDELNRLLVEEQTRLDRKIAFQAAYMRNESNVSYNDIKIMGNVIFNEARGLSKLEQSCVGWVILNRCDKYNSNIEAIASAKNQFAYKPNRVLSDKEKLQLAECEALAKDIILRYLCEKEGIEDVGRTLPSNYYYFHGDGKHNYFKTQWHSTDYWDYSLECPY